MLKIITMKLIRKLKHNKAIVIALSLLIAIIIIFGAVYSDLIVLHEGQSQRLERLVAEIKDPQLAEALVVRLAYKLNLNMLGKQFNDHISTIPHAKSVQVHPYPWFAAGSAGVVTSISNKFDIQIVLIKKKGRPNKWYLPGGYATAGPLAGGEYGIDMLEPHMKDEAEEGILKGELDSYRYVAKKYNLKYSNPDWQNIPEWDRDLEACAVREIKEEIGLDLTNKKMELVSHEVNYEGSIKHHSIDNAYLINLQTERPKLQPNGIEIADALWVPVKEIKVNFANPDSVTFFYRDASIPIDIAKQINQAVKKIRAQDFAFASKNAFIRVANLLKIPLQIPKLDWEFGEEAYLNHQSLLSAERDLLAKLQQSMTSVSNS